MNNLTDKELTFGNLNDLKFAFENGILDLDRVHELIMTSKRERVKALHPYSITPPSKAGDRWRTNYTDRNGKRTTFRAPTEDELLDKLIPLYLAEEDFENKTFQALYDEWILYKEQVTASPNTILRHKQHFRKYFTSSKLIGSKLCQLNEILLETECNRIVKEFCLSNKEWVNVKTILNGMFDYARRMKYLTENPMGNIKIHVKFRQVIKKTGKTQTYNTEELKAINEYLDEQYAATGDVSFMAVRMNFLMGLRVGELVALKWSDVDDIQLHVVREEIRDQTTNSVSVEEHTKTHTDRYVYLIPDALNILNSLPREGEYIFMRDGERLTARQINYVLEKYAKKLGVHTKSSHKLRKTFASMCSANGVPIDFIREQLGHSSLSTTYGYIYNPLTEKETYDAMTRALGSDTEPEPAPSGSMEKVIHFADFHKESALSPKHTHLSPKFIAK